VIVTPENATGAFVHQTSIANAPLAAARGAHVRPWPELSVIELTDVETCEGAATKMIAFGDELVSVTVLDAAALDELKAWPSRLNDIFCSFNKVMRLGKASAGDPILTKQGSGRPQRRAQIGKTRRVGDLLKWKWRPDANNKAPGPPRRAQIGKTRLVHRPRPL
jgi:hypothetical protein